jgi:peroxiredoxin
MSGGSSGVEAARNDEHATPAIHRCGALGLELDLSKGGLGVRSQRYSMLIDNAVVKSLNIEKQPGQVDVSGVEAMLRAL